MQVAQSLPKYMQPKPLVQTKLSIFTVLIFGCKYINPERVAVLNEYGFCYNKGYNFHFTMSDLSLVEFRSLSLAFAH